MISIDIFTTLCGNLTSDLWINHITQRQWIKRCFQVSIFFIITQPYNNRQSLRNDNQIPLASYISTNIQFTNSAHLLASGRLTIFAFRLHPSASQVLSYAFQQLVIIYQPLPGELSSRSCRLGRQTSAMFYICHLRYWYRRKWPPYCKRHIKLHFLGNGLVLYFNLTKCCPWGLITINQSWFS